MSKPKPRPKPKQKLAKPVDPTIGKLLAESPYVIEDGVTQSILSGWAHCRRACRYSLDGWTTAGTKDSLVYGSLYHWLLEKLFQGVMAGKYTRADVDAFFLSHTEKWMSKEKLDPTLTAHDLQAREVCIAQAEATFAEYCDQWADDFVPGRWVEVEGVFDVDFRGFKLRGRMDGLQRRGRRRKYLCLVEHKTMAQISEASLALRLAFDFQNIFYITAANAKLEAAGSTERVHTVCYDVIRRPTHKYNPDKETPASYSNRVRAHVVKEPDHFFKRTEITYTKKDLVDGANAIEEKLTLFRDWTLGFSPTYRNEQACIGKWNCIWLAACAAGGDMSEYVRTGKLFTELED